MLRSPNGSNANGQYLNAINVNIHDIEEFLEFPLPTIYIYFLPQIMQKLCKKSINQYYFKALLLENMKIMCIFRGPLFLQTRYQSWCNFRLCFPVCKIAYLRILNRNLNILNLES